MIILSLLARNFQLDRNLQIKKIEIEEMKKAPIKECTCMMKKETWNWDFYDASQKLLKMPDFSDSIRVSQSLNLWKDIRGSANQYFARTNGIANSLFSEPISALADATGKLKTSASSVLSEASIIPGEIKASTESIVSSVYDRASADFNKMKTSTQSSVDSVFKGARDKTLSSMVILSFGYIIMSKLRENFTSHDIQDDNLTGIAETAFQAISF
mmetsp:Transcript_43259/g.101427  ORF Transcript_43259/g.101427 Transcript_43259/m.101427 type:complete len:214 (-) Transcript_43259:134-775(-)